MKPKELARYLAQKSAAILAAKAQTLYADSIEYLEQEAQDVIASTTAFPANSPDDIIYSGQLKASQRTIKTKNSTLIQWNPKSSKGYPYAPKVVTGFKAWGKGRFVPGRDWATLALIKTQQAGGNVIGRTILDPQRGVVLKTKIRKVKAKVGATFK
jgi:hypothetical protein